jgi:cation transport ATPase
MKNQTVTNQKAKDQIKDLMLETVKKQEPETTKQLINLVQQTQNLPEREITELLIELENENKIPFTKKEPSKPGTAKEYVLSSKAAWYWTTIVFAVVTTVAVFTIPENAVPIVYVRSVLGAIFVLYLPGYTFIKALFPSKMPLKEPSDNMDNTERIAFSIGMSLALISIVALILNYTSWGIRPTPVTLSLLPLTVVFATAAIIREYQAEANPTRAKG